jgi:hypothetical protein
MGSHNAPRVEIESLTAQRMWRKIFPNRAPNLGIGDLLMIKDHTDAHT